MANVYFWLLLETVLPFHLGEEDPIFPSLSRTTSCSRCNTGNQMFHFPYPLVPLLRCSQCACQTEVQKWSREIMLLGQTVTYPKMTMFSTESVHPSSCLFIQRSKGLIRAIKANQLLMEMTANGTWGYQFLQVYGYFYKVRLGRAPFVSQNKQNLCLFLNSSNPLRQRGQEKQEPFVKFWAIWWQYQKNHLAVKPTFPSFLLFTQAQKWHASFWCTEKPLMME